MRTRLKNRLTVSLMMLIFVVISAISVTIIFALTQQQVTTDMSVEYYPETVTDNGVEYTLSDGEYIVSGCDKSVTNVTIPATINGKNVTAISASAFAECYKLQEVTLPNTIESIGNYAFDYCSSLTEVVIPDNVTNNSLGSYAFRYCSSLESLTLGSNITYFDLSWIFNCGNLNTITIKNNEFAEENVYWEVDVMEPLTTVITPDFTFKKETDGVYVSKGTSTPIGDLEIPETFFNTEITAISERAFSNCRNLSSVSIPNTINHIGQFSFYGCTSLESVTISDNVTIIDDYAFDSCKINEITLPSSLEQLGSRAFAFCSNLKSITIPKDVEEIGREAFGACDNLTSIKVDESNTVFTSRDLNNNEVNCIIDISNKSLIVGCQATEIPGDGSVEDLASSSFSMCDTLQSVSIPKGVKSIFDDAFRGCPNLLSVVISSSVNMISSGAFSYSYNLTSIKVDESNTVFTSRDSNNKELNCIINISNKSLIVGCQATEIPGDGSVERIGAHAFEGCETLLEIVIPSKIRFIDYRAFLNSSLMNATFENTENWLVVETQNATSGTNLNSTNLSQTSIAADYLKRDYCSYYWKRA